MLRAYYNDNDPSVCNWLRELIAAKRITDGDVDNRSICDVRASDLKGYDRIHFFAGIGGWDYALDLAGWKGYVWTGSCPCQPFSGAGKRKGISDERHLWPEFRRLVAECRPPTIFGEQVASRLGREWLAGVRADLEALGYAIGCADLCAAGVRAPHVRQRLFWVADAGRRFVRHERQPLAGTPSGVEGEEDKRQRLRPDLGDGIDAGRQANAAGARPLSSAHNGIHRGQESGRPWDVEPERSGSTERLAYAQSGDGKIPVRARRSFEACSKFGGSSAVSGLGDAIATGLQEQRGNAGVSRGAPGAEPRQAAVGTDTSSGFWSYAEWLQCLDGKARRVEPGIFPLVDGLPRGVVPSGDPGSPDYANAAAEARTMRLRGYGNAINPVLAAEFIRAATEKEPTDAG